MFPAQVNPTTIQAPTESLCTHHPEDAPNLPELSINTEDRRNMDNLIQDMQLF
jgi:hypothetical protein